MHPVSGVPEWRALIAELAAAPSDPVVVPPQKSTWWLWGIWSVPTGGFLIACVLDLFGSLPPEIKNALRSIPVPVYVLGISTVMLPIVHAIQQRGARRHNADLALFGFAEIEIPRLVVLRGGGRLRGSHRLTGRRWGRLVLVTIDYDSERPGSSAVSVAAPAPPFELVTQDQTVRATPGTPARVLQLLTTIGSAFPWSQVAVNAGPGGITVCRGSASRWARLNIEIERRWFYDLWLAERLAEALA